MEAHLARLPDVAARIRVARLPLLGAALVMATVVAGIVLTEALAERAYGSSLGVPLPPFFVFWSPRATWLAAVAPLVFAAALVAVPRLRSLRLGAPGYAASVFGLALGLRLALAAARAGTEGWYSAFASTGHAANEYLPSLPALDLGVGAFLDHFDQVAPTLSLHATAHPPGLLVLLDALSIGTPEAMAWLVLTGGSAAAPLTYLLGRRLLDEPRARLAALLFVFAPSALIWGATSADALFASLGAVAAVLLVAGPLALRALGGASLALASFFSYSLLAVGAWAVLVTGLRTTLRAGVRLAALSGSAVAAFYALLWAVAGFDPLGALGAADGTYAQSVAVHRPYLYWVFGSPAAFLVMLGLPTAWYLLRAASAREATALATVAVIAVAALLAYTKAETERIWLFLVPLACVAAASVLPARHLRWLLALLAVQAFAVELLFFTIW